MCQLCDGYSRDQTRRLIGAKIARTGFALVGVDGDPAELPWVYTIGLAAHGHPELVVAGVEQEFACAVLDDLAPRVVAGERFDACGVLQLNGEEMPVRVVDPIHIENGLLAWWFEYHAVAGVHPASPAVLQVVIPDHHFCCAHHAAQPQLHRGDTVMSLPRPNRAARRHPAGRRRRR